MMCFSIAPSRYLLSSRQSGGYPETGLEEITCAFLDADISVLIPLIFRVEVQWIEDQGA